MATLTRGSTRIGADLCPVTQEVAGSGPVAPAKCIPSDPEIFDARHLPSFRGPREFVAVSRMGGGSEKHAVFGKGAVMFLSYRERLFARLGSLTEKKKRSWPFRIAWLSV